MLLRQGDVLFQLVKCLPKGKQTKRENATIAYGEVTGHSHRIAVEDREVAEVIEVGEHVYVVVSDAGLRIHQRIGITEQGGIYRVDGCDLPAVLSGVVAAMVAGAALIHDEHGPTILPAGVHQYIQQCEWSPEEIRNVAD